MLPLTIANLKMLGRNRQTVFWALFFPLILVVVFGLFDFTSASSSDIAVIDQADSAASQQLVSALGDIEILSLNASPADMDSGRRMITDGDLDYLIVVPQGFAAPGNSLVDQTEDMTPVTLVLSTSDEERNQLLMEILSDLADEAVLGNPEVDRPETLVAEWIAIRKVPYFDLVLFGLVGMGIMTHAIISIAARISNYRNLSILKRMLATPVAYLEILCCRGYRSTGPGAGASCGHPRCGCVCVQGPAKRKYPAPVAAADSGRIGIPEHRVHSLCVRQLPHFSVGNGKRNFLPHDVLCRDILFDVQPALAISVPGRCPASGTHAYGSPRNWHPRSHNMGSMAGDGCPGWMGSGYFLGSH